MTDELKASASDDTTPTAADATPVTPVEETPPSACAACSACAPSPDEQPPVDAESFLRSELADAKASLKNTQLFGSIVVLLLGIYMIVVTATFVSNLQPQQAANVVSSFVSDQIDLHRDAFVSEVETRVPAMIQQAPDVVMKQIPEVRASLEQQFETLLRKQCQATSDKLGQNLEAYLTKNKDQIKALLETTKDPNAVATLAPSIRAEVMAYLKEKPATGQSIDEQINESLSMLRDAEHRLHRLATEKKLTPAELKTRRTVAIIANTIEKEQITPLSLPKLNLGK